MQDELKEKRDSQGKNEWVIRKDRDARSLNEDISQYE